MTDVISADRLQTFCKIFCYVSFLCRLCLAELYTYRDTFVQRMSVSMCACLSDSHTLLSMLS